MTAVDRRDGLRRPASLALMAASGCAGLGCQIVWTQQSALWLGHESAAVLAVVAAFFGGIALGALALGARIERSAHPLRWYAACEAAIGVWSVVLIAAMAPFSDRVLALTGAQPTPLWQWTVAFAATFALLLPATAAMGATLPAMERVMAQMHAQGRSIAAHYASNTLGAVVGVAVAAFWWVPAFGLVRTAALCAALNLLCAAVAVIVLPRAVATAPPAVTRDPRRARSTLSRLAVTGLLGIGYEVLVVRVLGQVTEDTVYTFAMLLAVYLVGSGLGAAAYQRWLARSRNLETLSDKLLCALAAACLIGTGSLWAAEQVGAWLMAHAGASVAAAIATEAALALAAFALPTLVMGALFSHLSARAHAVGVSFGQALGVNTAGAALAPLLFGVLLAPLLTPKGALLAIALAYLALATPRAWFKPAVWATAAAGLAVLVLAPPLAFVDVPEGGRIVSYQDGVMAAVSVVEDGDGVARLRINNRQQEGSSATRLVDARQALLPMLLHPSPHRALFLGLGTGVTASAAADDPGLEVDAVELLPEVIAASKHFARAPAAAIADSHLHVIAADARRYVRATTQRYDVIVSDNFHPARSGSGALYTVEHFQAVRDRLAPGGVFCQWLPLHQLDLTTLRSIVRSFLMTYPDASALLASNSLETPVIGLVGHAGAGRLDMAGVQRRLAMAAGPNRPAEFGIVDEFALLGSFVAGPQALARFAGSAIANTDDRPIVAYLAPRLAYAPDSQPRDRLLALLHELAIEPADVVDAATDAAQAKRLAAYWAARTRFIEAGAHVRPTADAGEMLAQVRAPLLAVLRTSPDFRPAYDPLLRMATALARTDRPAARALLTELSAATSERDDARAALLRLGYAAP